MCDFCARNDMGFAAAAPPADGNLKRVNGSVPSTGTSAGSAASNTSLGTGTSCRVVRLMSIHSLEATPSTSPDSSLSSKSRHATTLRPPRGNVSTVTLSSQPG